MLVDSPRSRWLAACLLVAVLVAIVISVSVMCKTQLVDSVSVTSSTIPSSSPAASRKVLSRVLTERELERVDALSHLVRWTTGRHRSYPTTDIPVGQVWELDMLMGDKLRRVIMPAIATAFGVDPTHLWLRDMFLVKYEVGAQVKLNMHRDASPFSFIVHINPLDEFEGGGTLFERDGALVRLRPGECLIFRGSERHAGVEVTRGRRIIVTGFVDCAAAPSELRRQYLMFNLRALVERGMFHAINFHSRRVQSV